MCSMIVCSRICSICVPGAHFSCCMVAWLHGDACKLRCRQAMNNCYVQDRTANQTRIKNSRARQWMTPRLRVSAMRLPLFLFTKQKARRTTCIGFAISSCMLLVMHIFPCALLFQTSTLNRTRPPFMCAREDTPSSGSRWLH